MISLVQPVDSHSRKSAHITLTPGEVAKLARISRKLCPDFVPVGEKAVSARRLRRRLTPQQTAELVVRYNAGEESPALSREYRISKCGLLQLLRTEGVELRKKAITSDDAKRAAQLYENGLTVDEVAAEIGRSYSSVRKVLHGTGVTMRPKGIKRRPATRGK